MATVKIDDLNSESAEAQPVTLEEAAQIVGGAEAKPKPKPKSEQQVYLNYKLENVLVSSYS
ncbi:MAG: hypothetical protein JNK74_19405 [Candidatus Hydrogenedentes bacterium]|nr:hypothetical protein [Candidatus Hydrogenedentota bacterium]